MPEDLRNGGGQALKNLSERQAAAIVPAMASCAAFAAADKATRARPREVRKVNLEIAAAQSARIAAWVEENRVGQGNRAIAWKKEMLGQSALLREIFGNPFRPVTVNPSWLTSNVTGIAQAIYDERDFEDLPVLGDALEDAGCDNADILNHCRQPGEHVRGCWVVDLILGKS
jgi:hypothetical protein